MAVISLVRAHPGLLVALCRHLDRAQEPVSKDTLYSRFVPGSLDTGPETAPALTFQNTLDFGQRIDVLAGTTKGIGVSEPHRGDWRDNDDVAIQGLLLDRLLDEALAGSDPFDADQDAPTADFARLATWLVRVDPTGPFVTFKPSAQGHPRKLMDGMGGNPDWVPRDQAGWDAFSRWAVALGLARERPTVQRVDQSLGLVPDVYRVVRDRIIRGLTSRVETLEALLQRLGESVPLLSTGRLDLAWNRYLSVNPEREVFSALSFALVRLAQEGVVDLVGAGDGVPYTLRFGRYADVPSPFGRRSAEVRPISNVRIFEEAT